MTSFIHLIPRQHSFIFLWNSMTTFIHIFGKFHENIHSYFCEIPWQHSFIFFWKIHNNMYSFFSNFYNHIHSYCYCKLTKFHDSIHSNFENSLTTFIQIFLKIPWQHEFIFRKFHDKIHSIFFLEIPWATEYHSYFSILIHGNIHSFF